MSDLGRELEQLVNRYCRENESNTPDFILAEYMLDALSAFERASLARERWYGRSLKIEFDPATDAPTRGVTE